MGGSTKVVQPSPPPAPAPAPSPGETTKQAIAAQVESLPSILQAQQEFGPQFQQQELDQAREFGPQWTEYGLGLAEQYGGQLNELARAEQQALAPERVAGSDAVTQFLEAGPEHLSEEDQRDMLNDLRSAQSARGMAYSGMANVDELKKITGLRQALKDRYLNVALSASGRLPTMGSSSVAAPNTSTNQLVQNVDPGTFFGGQASANQMASSIYSTQGGMFGSQANMYASQMANSSSPLGSILGGAAGTLVGAYTGGVGAGLANLTGGLGWGGN